MRKCSLLNHQFNYNIVCPYCGYEHDPSEYPNFYYTQDETETECEQCEKEFTFSGTITWEFSTEKIEDSEEEIFNDEEI